MKTKQLNKEQTQTRSAYLTRAVGDDAESNRTYEFTISTESRDSYGTIWLLSGWELDAYRKNPVVAYNHATLATDPDAIIGTSEVRMESDRLVGIVTLEEDNAIADKVKRKLDNGTLRMASVGAAIQEMRWGAEDHDEDPDDLYFTRQTLMEWSIVGIGANPDAHKRNKAQLKDIKSAFAKADDPKTPEFDEFEARFMLNQNLSK